MVRDSERTRLAVPVRLVSNVQSVHVETQNNEHVDVNTAVKSIIANSALEEVQVSVNTGQPEVNVSRVEARECVITNDSDIAVSCVRWKSARLEWPNLRQIWEFVPRR